jgi:hypothetical protein
VDLVSERVLRAMVVEEPLERFDEDADRAGAARHRRRRAEDQPVMLVAPRGEPVQERHEVGGVLGEQRPPLADAESEELLVGNPPETLVGAGFDDGP